MSMSPRTAHVGFDEFPFVVLVSARVNPSDTRAGRTGLVSSMEARARPRAGYGGAIWLAQGKVLGSPASPDSELLMGLLSWSSRTDAESFAAELSRLRLNNTFIDEGIYLFNVSVTASADDVGRGVPLRAQSGLVNEIITMTPVAGKQGWIAEYNESETRDHINSLDGSISTSFFRDLRSDRIVEYVQWRSADDLTAAFGDARFAEHMSVNSHYSTGEALLFGERLAGPDGDAIALHDEA